jgi:hypothetical protein
MLRDSPHHTEAAVNVTTPMTKILRRPYVSPKEPPMRRSAARKSA